MIFNEFTYNILFSLLLFFKFYPYLMVYIFVSYTVLVWFGYHRLWELMKEPSNFAFIFFLYLQRFPQNWINQFLLGYLCKIFQFPLLQPCSWGVGLNDGCIGFPSIWLIILSDLVLKLLTAGGTSFLHIKVTLFLLSLSLLEQKTL